MAGSTISTTVTTGVTLGTTTGGGTYASPLTIAFGGAIMPSGYSVVALTAALAGGYVLNKGAIYGSSPANGAKPGSTAVELNAGSLTNIGSIRGGDGRYGAGGFGIALSGGSVVNTRTIVGGHGGAGIAADPAGGVGFIGGAGAYLTSGSLTNNGTIIGGNGGHGGAGLYVGGAGGVGGAGAFMVAGSLTNHGTIRGGYGGDGGSANGTAAAGGVGGVGVLFQNGGTLVDAGYVYGGRSADGIVADAVHFGTGASRLILQRGAFFSGSVVANTSFNNVLELAAGTSAGTATLTGGIGVKYQGFNSITVDAGANWALTGGNTVAANVSWSIAGKLTNYGAIVGALNASGVYLLAGLLINAGTISGAANRAGVELAGGSLINRVSIKGGTGVRFHGGGTLLDAGYIAGTAGDAVDFGTGASLLLLHPGARLNGGAVANASFSNTLELVKGANPGTLSHALNAAYHGFSTIIVDADAQWTIGNSSTVVAGVSMVNSGAISGVLGPDGVYPRHLGGGFPPTDGGAGSTAINVAGGVLNNDATILGGAGGKGGSGSKYWGGGSGGAGGIGVYLVSGGLTNQGTIIGGAGGTRGAGAVSSGYGGYAPAYGAWGRGGVGVAFGAGGTLTNAGDIGGGNSGGYGIAAAVNFGTGAADLILDPGASFFGAVVAHAGFTNIMELATGSGTGTIAGLGDSITGFTTIDFDPAAHWLLAGNTAGIAAGQTIDGFDSGDTIELTGFAATSDTFATGGLVLTNTGGSETIGITGTFGPNDFAVTNDGTNSFVTVVPCFCAGTRIATPNGERTVESLAAGDVVLTASGAEQVITWLGVGRVPATPGRRDAATPVIVLKGALAENVPRRDLHLTKGHALCIDDVLIPVESLINGQTIVWDDRAQEVAIYHVELATHDILLADGAPAESYRDDGNRWLFRNANTGWGMPAQEPCAPVLTGGPVVDAIWQRLLEHAGPRTNRLLTDDADLHLLVDGQRLDAASRRGATFVFRLASRPESVRVVSRAAAPAELGLVRDPRRLGVALRQIMVTQGIRVRTIEADDTSLTAGFHEFEPDNGFRWTDGDAAVPTSLFSECTGPFELVLRVGCSTQYVADDTRRRAA